MSEAEVLNVTVRKSRGSSVARRERQAGKIPAVLYGLGGENVCLSVPADELTGAIRHGSQFVEIHGDVSDAALIREVQWDAFGIELLHVDLTRVEKEGTAEFTVSVELRGVAPGTRAGGVVQQPLHEIEIKCPVRAIPEKLSMNINTLELGETLTAAAIELPDGVELLTDPEVVIVQCVEPTEELEAEDGALPAGSVEPEIIGRKEEEEGKE